ncbi:MAG: hypothetical protein DMG67_08745 [Acidobacteria bacterium]|nr:MAG: hypothetical protein DMG67_08745 [Acidobacteriota bacterium]
MNSKKTILIVLLSVALTAQAQVKVTVDHNTGPNATPDFKFKNVPSPVKDNAATQAKLKLVVGAKDDNGADLSVLTDGLLPAEQDQPAANFFFNAGSDGGRFLMDLGTAIEIAQVNSYSWHPDTRGPQIYALFASDGTTAKFNLEPDAKTDPTSCGWKLIASVDTRPKQGDSGGQYGVSITDASGSLGKFRYLLFDAVPTESDDAWGNTFFSEIDVVAKK